MYVCMYVFIYLQPQPTEQHVFTQALACAFLAL